MVATAKVESPAAAELVGPDDVLELLRRQCQALLDRGVPASVVEAALFGAACERLVLTRGWARAAATLHEVARELETEVITDDETARH